MIFIFYSIILVTKQVWCKIDENMYCKGRYTETIAILNKEQGLKFLR